MIISRKKRQKNKNKQPVFIDFYEKDSLERKIAFFVFFFDFKNDINLDINKILHLSEEEKKFLYRLYEKIKQFFEEYKKRSSPNQIDQIFITADKFKKVFSDVLTALCFPPRKIPKTIKLDEKLTNDHVILLSIVYDKLLDLCLEYDKEVLGLKIKESYRKKQIEKIKEQIKQYLKEKGFIIETEQEGNKYILRDQLS